MIPDYLPSKSFDYLIAEENEKTLEASITFKLSNGKPEVYIDYYVNFGTGNVVDGIFQGYDDAVKFFNGNKKEHS